MKSVLYPLMAATLFCSCQPTKSQPDEKKQAQVSTDSTQYFTDLHSDEVVKSFLHDSVPKLKKVIIKSFIIDSISVWANPEGNTFYNIADVFPYNTIHEKPQNAIVVFAKYWGEKRDQDYKIYDSHASAPTLFYGIYAYQENKGWYLQKKSNEAFSNQFSHHGQYGMVGDIGLEQSGKKRYALNLSGEGTGQGYTGAGITYYDIALEKTVFDLNETTSNSGAVEEDEAFEFKFTARFIPSDKDFFDLEVNYEGTHYDERKGENDDAPSEVVPFKKKVIYHFDTMRGKYIESK